MLNLVDMEQHDGDLPCYQDWAFVKDLASTLQGSVVSLQEQVVEVCAKFASAAIAFTESAAAVVHAAVLQHGTDDAWNEAALATSKCIPTSKRKNMSTNCFTNRTCARLALWRQCCPSKRVLFRRPSKGSGCLCPAFAAWGSYRPSR